MIFQAVSKVWRSLCSSIPLLSGINWQSQQLRSGGVQSNSTSGFISDYSPLFLCRDKNRRAVKAGGPGRCRFMNNRVVLLLILRTETKAWSLQIPITKWKRIFQTSTLVCLCGLGIGLGSMLLYRLYDKFFPGPDTTELTEKLPSGRCLVSKYQKSYCENVDQDTDNSAPSASLHQDPHNYYSTSSTINGNNRLQHSSIFDHNSPLYTSDVDSVFSDTVSPLSVPSSARISPCYCYSQDGLPSSTEKASWHQYVERTSKRKHLSSTLIGDNDQQEISDSFPFTSNRHQSTLFSDFRDLSFNTSCSSSCSSIRASETHTRLSEIANRYQLKSVHLHEDQDKEELSIVCDSLLSAGNHDVVATPSPRSLLRLKNGERLAKSLTSSPDFSSPRQRRTFMSHQVDSQSNESGSRRASSESPDSSAVISECDVMFGCMELELNRLTGDLYEMSENLRQLTDRSNRSQANAEDVANQLMEVEQLADSLALMTASTQSDQMLQEKLDQLVQDIDDEFHWEENCQLDSQLIDSDFPELSSVLRDIQQPIM